jgi:hypothetical protein
MSSNPSLFELQTLIDEAWEESRNLDLVADLATRYPEHADELFAFAEALLFEDDPLPPPLAQAALRAGDAALAAVPPPTVSPSAGAPQTLLAVLVAESGLPPSQAAAAMEDMPLPLLISFSDHPQIVTERAREEFATRAQRGLGVARDRVLSCFNVTPPLARAASRRGPAAADPTTYDDLLDRARLTPELRTLWSTFREQP